MNSGGGEPPDMHRICSKKRCKNIVTEVCNRDFAYIKKGELYKQCWEHRNWNRKSQKKKQQQQLRASRGLEKCKCAGCGIVTVLKKDKMCLVCKELERNNIDIVKWWNDE